MIEVKNLSIHLGEFSLEDVDLTIGDGEYFVILGPTGAGKSVLLECIAGLHRIRKGEIWMHGRDVTNLTPEERGTGYVPQDYVLFPFLNVADNIAFGLRQEKCPRAEVKERVTSLARLMGIPHLLGRDPRTLSGGEKQRAALARALATSPGILLLDEPLSALDAQTTKYLRQELLRIHRKLGLTTIHITHDLMEAVEMADRVAIIQGGTVAQTCEAKKLLFYPENEAVADFIGAPNILDCDYCHSTGHGVMEIGCGELKLVVPHEDSPVKKIAILPRHVYVSETEPPGPGVNRFKGTITGINEKGGAIRVGIAAGGNHLVAEIPHHIFDEMTLSVGQEIYFILRIRRIRVYEGGNGK